jgi:hypothetical protein
VDRRLIRLSDVWYLLPQRPAAALVLGDLPQWSAGLDADGIPLARVGTQLPASALVVAPRQLARQALALTAAHTVIVGSSVLPLRERRGRTVRTLVPAGDAPPLLLPLDDAVLTSYGLRQWRAARSAPRLSPARLIAQGIRWRKRESVLALMTSGHAASFLAAAAADLGVSHGAASLLTLHDAATSSRSVLLLFDRKSPSPRWALKISRRTDPTTRLEHERRGLAAAHRASPRVAAHVPAFLGVVNAEGCTASVETAAAGVSLSSFLRSARNDAAKEETLDAIARWICELARTTATPSSAVETLRARIASTAGPATASFVRQLPAVPGVLQHRDLGGTNIIVDEGRFTVIDWEHSRVGLPLLDTCGFARTSLPDLDSVPLDAQARTKYLVQTFRGETATSKLLFRWIREAVAANDLPTSAVGPLVGLAWEMLGKDELSRAWAEDPRLGGRWSAWRA